MIQKKKGFLRMLRTVSLASGAITGFLWGLFLPALFQNTFKPGLAAAVMGTAVLAAFGLFSSFRRFPELPAVLLMSGCFLCRVLLPSGVCALAADGFLLGTVLTAGRSGNRTERCSFFAAFLLAAALGGSGIWSSAIGAALLYPGMFFAGALRFPLKTSGRWALMLMAVPVAVISVFPVIFRGPRTDPAMPPIAGLSAASLPDCIQVDMLRIGKTRSNIGAVWRELPFAGTRCAVRKNVYNEKVLKGPPGTALLQTPGVYDLIFVEELPPGDQHRFCEVLWQKLDPEHGVLVLPASRRDQLPKLEWHVLPGSRGRCAVSFRGHVPDLDPESLDSALQRKLADAGAENFIPGGIMSALLLTPEPSLPPLPAPVSSGTRNFWIAVTAYLLLAALWSRKERCEIFLAAAGNGCACLLILLAAFQYCRSLVLFSGISPGWVLAAFALVFTGFSFGPAVRRALGIFGIATVCWWFLNPMLLRPALFAAVFCGLFTALEHKALCRMKILSRQQLDLALLVGAILGSVLFQLLAPQDGSSLLGCVLLALLPRLVALFRR